MPGVAARRVPDRRPPSRREPGRRGEGARPLDSLRIAAAMMAARALPRCAMGAPPRRTRHIFRAIPFFSCRPQPWALPGRIAAAQGQCGRSMRPSCPTHVAYALQNGHRFYDGRLLYIVRRCLSLHAAMISSWIGDFRCLSNMNWWPQSLHMNFCSRRGLCIEPLHTTQSDKQRGQRMPLPLRQSVSLFMELHHLCRGLLFSGLCYIFY